MHDADSGLKHHNSLTGHTAILGPYPKEKEGTHRPQLLMSLLILLSITFCVFHSCLPPSQHLSACATLHSVVWERELPESEIQAPFQAPRALRDLTLASLPPQLPTAFPKRQRLWSLTPRRRRPCSSLGGFAFPDLPSGQFPPPVLPKSSLASRPCSSGGLPRRAFPDCTVVKFPSHPCRP